MSVNNLTQEEQAAADAAAAAAEEAAAAEQAEANRLADEAAAEIAAAEAAAQSAGNADPIVELVKNPPRPAAPVGSARLVDDYPNHHIGGVEKKVPVLPNSTFTCNIGHKDYSFVEGHQQNVPENVKNILRNAGKLGVM